MDIKDLEDIYDTLEHLKVAIKEKKSQYIDNNLYNLMAESKRLYDDYTKENKLSRRFIAFPKDRKDSDGNEDFSLVSIHEDGYPCCKKHGAMNKVNSEIWRCLSRYGYVKQEGETMSKFKDRICNACCLEENKEVKDGK